MNYYLVTAKCGHIGRGKYLEVAIPIVAESKHDAAQKCLLRPKVKRHLKNAISHVCETTKDEFAKSLFDFKNNPYVKAHTKKEVLPFLESAQLLDLRKSKKKSFLIRDERI